MQPGAYPVVIFGGVGVIQQDRLLRLITLTPLNEDAPVDLYGVTV